MFSDFEKLLKEKQYKIATFKRGKITKVDLEKFKMVILGLPQEQISDGEIQAILDFVAAGGGLLLASGWGTWPWDLLGMGRPSRDGTFSGYPSHKKGTIKIINELAAEFGIIFEQKLINGGRKRYFEKFSLGRFVFQHPLPIISAFKPHPIVENVAELIIRDCIPLHLSKEMHAIGFTDADTEPPSCIVLAAGEYDRGKIIALSSPAVFLRKSYMKIGIDYGLSKQDHQNLAINIVNWLSN
ncbi:MAG TPA: hypothetical protein VMV49_18790 [Candidatus Deferrimicrobium sp.]|nr:hypothetical protein [Candidatus Deferrimicrobium sp.]